MTTILNKKWKSLSPLEKNLVKIFIGASSLVVILVLAMNWIRSALTESIERNAKNLNPIEEKLMGIDATLKQLIFRQAQVSTAKNFFEIREMDDEISERLNDNLLGLEITVKQLEKNDKEVFSDDIKNNITKLLEISGEFVEKDIEFIATKMSLLSYQDDFNLISTKVEALLKKALQLTVSATGKARFSHRRAVRQLKKEVARGNSVDETDLDRVISGDSYRIQSTLNELLILLENLNLNSVRLDIIENLDHLRSHEQNKITQNIAGIKRAINSLKVSLTDNPRMLSSLKEIEEILSSALGHISRTASKNMIEVRRQIIKQGELLESTWKASKDTSEEMFHHLNVFVDQVKELSKVYFEEAQESSSMAKNIVILITILGTIAAALGANKVVDGMSELGVQNKKLEKLNIERSLLLAEVEHKNKDLSEANSSLEARVAERTKELKNILDNVHIGFFIINRNLSVMPGFTKSCFEILGHIISEGDSLQKVLQLDEKQVDLISLCIDQIYQDLLPEDVSVSQIPSRLKVNSLSVGLNISVIRDGEARVSSLLVTVSDLSELEQAEKVNNTNKALVNILSNRDTFIEFVDSFRSEIQFLKGEAKKSGLQTQKVKMSLHTLKGNAASFQLVDLAEGIHNLESEKNFDAADIRRIEKGLSQFLEEHSSVLELQYAQKNSEVVKVEKSLLQQLYQLTLRKEDGEVHKGEVGKLVSFLLKQPAQTLIGPLENTFSRLKQKLGKKARLTVLGGAIRFDPSQTRLIFANLIHLIRNALDHGIEPPVDRGKKNKVGQITVEFREDREHQYIEVSDDGRGIDGELFREKIVEAHIMTRREVETKTSEELVQYLFHPGISSAKEVTDISGRGIGMSAFKKACDTAGADIKVITTVGEGTRFKISLPRREKMGTAEKARQVA